MTGGGAMTLENDPVDPFTSTIIKQGTVLAVGTGLLVFGIFVLIRMASLQRAMLNNIYPSTLP